MTTAERHTRRIIWCAALVTMVALVTPATTMAGESFEDSGRHQPTVLTPLTSYEMKTVAGGQDEQIQVLGTIANDAAKMQALLIILEELQAPASVITLLEGLHIVVMAWELSQVYLEATVPDLSSSIYQSTYGYLNYETQIKHLQGMFNRGSPSTTFVIETQIFDYWMEDWYCGDYGCWCDDNHPQFPCDEAWECNEWTGLCDEIIVP